MELSGGLANQLFQWSAGRVLADEHGVPLILDASLVCRPDGRGLQVDRLSDHERLVEPGELTRRLWSSAHRWLPRVPLGLVKRIALRRPRATRRCGDLRAARVVLGSGRSPRLAGLFQEPDLLFAQRENIRERVRTRLPAGGAVASLPENYAAVHIRRGDYVSNEKYRRLFGVCSEQYFRRAIRRLDPSLPIAFVSDDPAWCRSFATSLGFPAHRILPPSGNDHFDDLATIARAKEVVLSNSTFSWWGVYLGEPVTVICPEPWFTERSRDRGLVLPGWIRVPRD
ncbi:alpha-1,2-fucosyltransferase [Nakamurella flavida]|uniref:Alpha-1,2-fucosyltransferase n=1 Tax=Nakamurella flavida TaxID=363630 RepID=A0A938YHI1_9ACTN|nr:alpha-1,2-fucosyltransferase [Nakamurella flavida]